VEVSVDEEKCIGCGACVSICPDVFEIGDNGKSHPKVKETNEECAEDARDACPVGAIVVD